jgi:uncharacterized membrane protein
MRQPTTKALPTVSRPMTERPNREKHESPHRHPNLGRRSSTRVVGTVVHLHRGADLWYPAVDFWYPAMVAADLCYPAMVAATTSRPFAATGVPSLSNEAGNRRETRAATAIYRISLALVPTRPTTCAVTKGPCRMPLIRLWPVASSHLSNK